MPKYRWHLIGALFAFFVFLLIFKTLEFVMDFNTMLFSLLACMFGGLFPDIDSKKSKIHRVFVDFIVIVIAAIIILYAFERFETMLWLLLLWFLLAGVAIQLPMKHRGFIHSIWIAIIFGFLIGFIAQTTIGSFVPGFFAFVGYFSHLAIDKRM